MLVAKCEGKMYKLALGVVFNSPSKVYACPKVERKNATPKIQTLSKGFSLVGVIVGR